MFIVILSIVGITIEYIEDMESAGNRTLIINPTIIRVMRVLRIARGIALLLETVPFHARCSNFRPAIQTRSV